MCLLFFFFFNNNLLHIYAILTIKIKIIDNNNIFRNFFIILPLVKVTGGLAGLIIVEDPITGAAAMPAHLAAISCPENCQHEIPLLFQPTLQYADETGFRRGYGQLQQTPEESFTGIGDDILFR